MILLTVMPCCWTICGSSGIAGLQAVLHLHLGDVRIGAAVEGQRDVDRAVRGRCSRTCRSARRAPVMCLLDDLGHRILDRLGVAPG